MNRKKFIGLILLMVISLVGIIGVQVIWISNAVRVRNDQFNFLVANSLRNTAGYLESSRRMAFLNQQFLDSHSFDDTLRRPDNMPGRHGPKIRPEDENFSYQFRHSSSEYTSGDGKRREVSGSFEIGSSGGFGEDSVEIIYSSNGNPPVRMRVQSSKADSAMSSVMVPPDEYRHWMEQRASEFKNLSSQIVSEMYNWEKNLVVDKNEAGFTLRNELRASGIFTPFEFAIIKADSVFDGYYSRVKPREFLNSPYQINLFSDGLLRKGDIISVVFPDRTRSVLGPMIWLLIGSLLFSLIIISTFGLSLYMIISQKKVSEMKSDFINNMTHEFKTPIATISLAADTIANQKVIKDEEKVRHFIGMIKKENARMNQQVENILQISTLDRREMDFVFRETDIHQIINHAIETIGIQVHERGGKIECSLDAENSIIAGDPEHLRNLVHNLLDNANKYAEEKPLIKVSTRNNNYGIFLVVEDNGIGMTKTVQSKIFERFYRQTSGNVHNVKGFGLGLNYVKSIVDAHNGTVTVESEPGCGSCFTVFLPFNREAHQ
jgi:two-component system, OmpR family, phosphate regulon sensor histidine kinase PhoR